MFDLDNCEQQQQQLLFVSLTYDLMPFLPEDYYLNTYQATSPFH